MPLPYLPPQAVADSRMPLRQGDRPAILPCLDDRRRLVADMSTFRKFPRFYVQPTQFPPSVNLRFAQYAIKVFMPFQYCRLVCALHTC